MDFEDKDKLLAAGNDDMNDTGMGSDKGDTDTGEKGGESGGMTEEERKKKKKGGFGIDMGSDTDTGSDFDQDNS